MTAFQLTLDSIDAVWVLAYVGLGSLEPQRRWPLRYWVVFGLRGRDGQEEGVGRRRLGERLVQVRWWLGILGRTLTRIQYIHAFICAALRIVVRT
jgi:hypothetical protein